MRQRSRTLRLSLLGSRGGAVALIAIGMLLLGMLAGCGGGASQTPRSSTGVAPSPAGSASPAVSSRKTTPNVPEIVKPAAVAPFQGGSRIAVQEESYDFGKVKLDDWVQATFHVQNVGDAALLLNGQPGVRTIQGCWPPDAKVVGSTTLKPGDTTTITVEFTMGPGMAGPHDFAISIKTNDKVEPEKVVHVKADFVS